MAGDRWQVFGISFCAPSPVLSAVLTRPAAPLGSTPTAAAPAGLPSAVQPRTTTVAPPHQRLAASQHRPLTIVDCSNISPSASRDIAGELAMRGIDFLEAPCSGSKSGAEKATLTFMIGGGASVFERVRRWLEGMGKQFYYCGSAGMGLQAKLSQNMILGGLLQAFNESFVLATKAGVSPRLLLDINNSAARSGLVAATAPVVFERNFEPNFSVKWLEKDLGLMLDSAAEMNVPVPVTALAKQMCRAAIAQGDGDDDVCGSIRVLEQLAGCEVTAVPEETATR